MKNIALANKVRYSCWMKLAQDQDLSTLDAPNDVQAYIEIASALNVKSIPLPVWKIILILLTLIFGTGSIRAQTAVSDTWSKPNLLSYDSMWRYHPGKANPDFFLRDFNDGKWQTVDFHFLENITPHTADFENVGVFRRKFFVPDSMKGKPVDLFFGMVGACEIYFDGNLVYRKGEISDPISNYFAFQITVPLFLDDLPWHVVSIYYGSSISHSRANTYNLKGLALTMVATQKVIGDNNDVYHHWLVSFGIIAGFALFFWFVFAFYPDRIASLASAVMLTNFSLIFLGTLIRDATEPSLTRFIIGEKLWEMGFATSFGWLLFFVYTAFYKKLPKYTFVVIVLIVAMDLVIILEYQYWSRIAVPLMGLCVIESWRMITKGIIKRKTGFWIIAIGLLGSMTGALVIIFNVFHVFPAHLTPIQTVLGVASDLIFPLMLALHLAWEFGSANRDLKQQLTHVGELSQKSILQEQEKQQLLANQNETLEKQVTERTATLNQSLHDLKSAQQQLIQSEKMASLGALTAGIAHEIQNPLNFVNNFSDINKELIGELVEEVDKGNYDEVKLIAGDIKDNEEKINHHGKRAEGIVKGMLQHSRSNKGQKEPTDINALADEYLRIAYHGIRAKDKTFNAVMKTSFDDRIGNVSIVPQDIGRVLLNIINNAFYAVREKQKNITRQNQHEKYEPAVFVKTQLLNEKLVVTVNDNANGIPAGIIDKIFQPFFTTKHTSEGTGLGLSLAYDIVKTHGGEIKVSSQMGAGSTFIIVLPIT